MRAVTFPYATDAAVLRYFTALPPISAYASRCPLWSRTKEPTRVSSLAMMPSARRNLMDCRSALLHATVPTVADHRSVIGYGAFFDSADKARLQFLDRPRRRGAAGGLTAIAYSWSPGGGVGRIFAQGSLLSCVRNLFEFRLVLTINGFVIFLLFFGT